MLQEKTGGNYMQQVKVKFKGDLLKKSILRKVVSTQTRKLEKYAKQELHEMAKRVAGRYENDTYNLQDSLVWCLYYDGKLKSYGFYGGGRASKESYLHAFGYPTPVPVHGREEAMGFVTTYKPQSTSGWECVWAATAPYAGYLEGGFTMKHSGRRIQFYVITQRYDHIKNVFEPIGHVDYEINVPIY